MDYTALRADRLATVRAVAERTGVPAALIAVLNIVVRNRKKELD